MAKSIVRLFQNLFGSSAYGLNQVGEFGSLKNGSPTFATDASDVQTNTSNFTGGWQQAVVGQNYPAIEDRNALDCLLFYQLAYLLQQGVAEYDPSTTYYAGSTVAGVGTGVLYVCINDNSGVGISNEPVTNSTYWDLAIPYGGNFLLNGAFDWWQRGTSFNVSGTESNPAFTYTADRWAALNLADGTSGTSVMAVSQVAGTLDQSSWGLQAKFTTAPSSGSSKGAQIYQMFGLQDSLQFSGKNAVFGCWIKAVGNINEVTLSFVSADASPMPPNLTPIGASKTFSVNSSAFTFCSLPATAIGSGLGYVGIQILANAASSGNATDSGNGFVVELAQACLGGVLGPFTRAFDSSAAEFQALLAYYETSYNALTVPGTASTFDGAVFQMQWVASTKAYFPTVLFRAPKTPRLQVIDSPPTITLYNPSSGSTSTPIHDSTGSGSDYVGNVFNLNSSGFTFFCDSTSPVAGDILSAHWTADGELY